MLDLKFIREQPAAVRAGLQSRHQPLQALEDLLSLDQERRRLITQVETLKHQRNEASLAIGQLKKAGQDTAQQQQAVKELGARIAQEDQRLRALEEQLKKILLELPNLPHASTPPGAGAADNRVVRSWGEPRALTCAARTHLELGEQLGILDFTRASRLAGAGFPLLIGQGARLERALINFMLDLHRQEHGYLEVAPPFLCNAAAMTGTGQLPKMAEDMYHLPTDNLYLIPTAEVSLTNIYREEIINRPLPIRLVAYSPCFRREAGAAGRETRGLIRVHQFDKVEMVKFVEPATSDAELETLVANAEAVLQRLELAYRVVLLCGGDLGFAAAKCYDLEVWAPGQKAWLEVSSCSNCEAFQARRAGIRYRNQEGKVDFVHTLNGSGLALARVVVALLENGQEPDGSVLLPAALAPYLDGQRRLAPDAQTRL